MGRIPRPSPAMLVAMISLIVAIGGTAFALPGKFSVGRDDLKEGSIGARSLGRATLDYGFAVQSTDSFAGDGIFTETIATIRCPAKSPFAFDPFVSGLGARAFQSRRTTFTNRWGGPGAFRYVISSDEGPDKFFGLSVNCLPTR